MTRIYEDRRPMPPEIITEDYIEDVELGLIKTGKEADVFLIERRARDRSCLLAQKRYRPPDQRGFKNTAVYSEHRHRTRMVRENGYMRAATDDRRELAAIKRNTDVGKALRHGEWMSAEWDALNRLWQAGAPVPCPVDRAAGGMLMEYVGDRDEAAPRLVHARLPRTALDAIAAQVVEALRAIARCGLVHGDLSPYNILVWEGRVWVIDLPQVVPYLDNDAATELLHRDVVNACEWFARRGVAIDAEEVFAEVLCILFDYEMEDLFRAH